MVKKTAIFLFLNALLTSCVGGQAVISAPTYMLEVSDPDRVQFSGRGAGAGMMLSGSMGSMGIALGVAIDVGIGKDIGETAAEAGVSFPILFKELASVGSNISPIWVEETIAANRVYRIERYGFVVAKGGDDEVYPSLIVQITEVDGPAHRITVPDDFLDTPEVLPRAKFQDIKTDTEEIERLWRGGISLALGIVSE